MPAAPIITIFVRHSAECKYVGDEFEKRCRCRKHLRWSHNGKQHRRKAGTRSWAEAEDQKRRLEDQLAGRAPQDGSPDHPLTVSMAVDIFMTAKKNDGLE